MHGPTTLMLLREGTFTLTAFLFFVTVLPSPHVRIESHRGCGTVIATEPGRSWVLSAGHLFGIGKMDHRLITRTIAISGNKAKARVIACDLQADLSLIEMDDGPLPVCPVAPRWSRWLWLETGGRRVTLSGREKGRILTLERPEPGQSGSGLISRGHLFGVVQGWNIGSDGESGDGCHVDHEAVLRFLEPYRGRMASYGEKLKSPSPPPLIPIP